MVVAEVSLGVGRGVHSSGEERRGEERRIEGEKDRRIEGEKERRREGEKERRREGEGGGRE